MILAAVAPTATLAPNEIVQLAIDVLDVHFPLAARELTKIKQKNPAAKIVQADITAPHKGWWPCLIAHQVADVLRRKWDLTFSVVLAVINLQQDKPLASPALLVDTAPNKA